MAQYVAGADAPRTVLIDFVDVDSAKWVQYADSRWWPLSWVYRREGSRLLAFERAAADRATRAFFVTDAEADLFRRLAPGCVGRIETIGNGVDTEQYAPSEALPSPFAAGSLPVVFTGAMDYWPNVDGVRWFAEEVMPRVLDALPSAHFTIVGMRPTAAVKALASAHVTVTGTVPDVRPYLQHAAVVVAPLRVARGIQNKILEAMAMARPVVATDACGAGLPTNAFALEHLRCGGTHIVLTAANANAIEGQGQRAVAINTARFIYIHHDTLHDGTRGHEHTAVLH